MNSQPIKLTNRRIGSKIIKIYLARNGHIMKKDKISSAVIRRLPRYYRHLDDILHTGDQRFKGFFIPCGSFIH